MPVNVKYDFATMHRGGGEKFHKRRRQKKKVLKKVGGSLHVFLEPSLGQKKNYT